MINWLRGIFTPQADAETPTVEQIAQAESDRQLLLLILQSDVPEDEVASTFTRVLEEVGAQR